LEQDEQEVVERVVFDIAEDWKEEREKDSS
jgi:hypothetical protein